MLSGRRLDLLDPAWADIEIEDIAHGLSRVARWNGQTSGDWAFSVADHSLLVEALCGALKPDASAELRLYALLHDAPEYVIGDLISPFKAVVGDGYKSLETRIFEAIMVKYGLPARPKPAWARLVKQADKISAYVEALRLAGFASVDADKFFVRPPDPTMFDLLPVERPPNVAKDAFLARFEALNAQLS